MISGGLSCWSRFWSGAICLFVGLNLLVANVAANVPSSRASAQSSGADMEQTGAKNVLFIHHSCGGQLLADPGQDIGEHCIYTSHFNGGGLRTRLTTAGYVVHELSYGSRLGEDTDIQHWRHKFTETMPELLRTDHQDQLYDDETTNDIIAFKSCYPNNRFVDTGDPPGDPDSTERTIANAKAAYRALLPEFQKQPGTLFIAFTAPPRAEPIPRGWKARIKAWLKGKGKDADWAREFNTWLVDRKNGWLAGYPETNVAVFDYYDILTAEGKTNWSAYPSDNGKDSHPNQEGNRKAAALFVEFLAQTVSRMKANP